MSTILKLAPPWYFLRNEIASTLGQDPNIQVSQLIPLTNDQYELQINVLNYCNQAIALRKIIKPQYSISNKIILVKIFSKCSLEIPCVSEQSCYTPEELGTILDDAFLNNPLYKGYVLTPNEASINQKEFLGDVVMIVAKELIQFFNDDFRDLYQNFNGIATEVFKDFLIQEYASNIKLSFSTYDENFSNNYSKF